MEIWQAYSVEQTVYFESQTDRVLINVEFTAVIVLKYRDILSLDCLHQRIKCIAQGHNAVPPMRLESSTLPLSHHTPQFFTEGPGIKEHLAIRRTFSLVDMITNTKFSNCPNVFEIGVVWQ